jgi:hypothetical protein
MAEPATVSDAVLRHFSGKAVLLGLVLLTCNIDLTIRLTVGFGDVDIKISAQNAINLPPLIKTERLWACSIAPESVFFQSSLCQLFKRRSPGAG